MTHVVRFHQTGGPEVLRIEELDVGVPGPGEIRVRVEAIGLNRAESMFRSGAYLDQPRLPARLGYEASAVVEAVGKDVNSCKVGKAVSVIPAFSMNDYRPRRRTPVTALAQAMSRGGTLFIYGL